MAPRYVAFHCNSEAEKRQLFELLDRMKKEPLAVVPTLDLFCSCPPQYAESASTSSSSGRPDSRDDGFHSNSTSPPLSSEDGSQGPTEEGPVFTDLTHVTSSSSSPKDYLPDASSSTAATSFYDAGYDPTMMPFHDTSYNFDASMNEGVDYSGQPTEDVSCSYPTSSAATVKSPYDSVKEEPKEVLSSSFVVPGSGTPVPKAGKVSILWKLIAETLVDDETDIAVFTGSPEELAFSIIDYGRMAEKLAPVSKTTTDKLRGRLHTYLWNACLEDRYLAKTKSSFGTAYIFKRDGWIMMEHCLAELGVSLEDFKQKGLEYLERGEEVERKPVTAKGRVQKGRIWKVLVDALLNSDHDVASFHGSSKELGFRFEDLAKFAEVVFDGMGFSKSGQTKKVRAILYQAVNSQSYLRKIPGTQYCYAFEEKFYPVLENILKTKKLTMEDFRKAAVSMTTIKQE